MAIPYTNYPLLQPPIHQLPPALVPTDLLAAIEGWDARTAWPGTGVSAPGAGGYLNRSLLPSSISPLEGAGRMSQEGGIIGRASSVIPSKAGKGYDRHLTSVSMAKIAAETLESWLVTKGDSILQKMTIEESYMGGRNCSDAEHDSIVDRYSSALMTDTSDAHEMDVAAPRMQQSQTH